LIFFFRSSIPRAMQPVVATLLFDLIVLVLVVVLFKYLRSEATASGNVRGIGKWTAGGALAGFLILMGVQLYLVRYFTPEGEETLASYQTIAKFYDSLRDRNYPEAWKLLSPEFQKKPKPWGGKFDRFADGYTNTER